MTQAVTSRVEDGIAFITLNRPEALNAINEDVRRELPAAIDAAGQDPDVRVLVIGGAGERAFCAGADIKEFAAADSPAIYRDERVHHHWMAAFERASKPILASIHGHCLGGGLEIALACDLRIAATNAVFGFPETGLGIIPGAGGTQRITRVVGLGVALDMVLSGERIDAQRALAVTLVSRLVEPAQLESATRELARRIAAKPPLAIRFAKEAVKQSAETVLAAGLRQEIDLLAHLLNTQDRLEAAAAFREKRPAVFTGR
jgi:enoyl-CoA hydratase